MYIRFIIRYYFVYIIFVGLIKLRVYWCLLLRKEFNIIISVDKLKIIWLVIYLCFVFRILFLEKCLYKMYYIKYLRKMFVILIFFEVIWMIVGKWISYRVRFEY